MSFINAHTVVRLMSTILKMCHLVKTINALFPVKFVIVTFLESIPILDVSNAVEEDRFAFHYH